MKREPTYQCWQIWQPVDWQNEGPEWAHAACRDGRLAPGHPVGGLLALRSSDGKHLLPLRPGDWLVRSDTDEITICPDYAFERIYELTGRPVERKRSVLEW